MAGELRGLAGPLHLDDADPIPDQVEKTAVLRILEAGNVHPVCSKTVEQFVQKGLSLGSLRSVVCAPGG